jgi:hypothetical protein
VLLVEENLQVAEALASEAIVLDEGRVVWRCAMEALLADTDLTVRCWASAGRAPPQIRMTFQTFVLLLVTGLGLSGVYFLIASGLSLIFGLMDLLDLAHGLVFTAGSYTTWWVMNR